MIEFHAVNKYYGHHQVLVEVTQKIEQGETVVLCGPSGSGKSTWLRAINRMEEIDSGQILVNGTDTHGKGVHLDRLRSGIGFVFQQLNLFAHLTVLANCTLAPVRLKRMTAAEAKDYGLVDHVVQSRIDIKDAPKLE